jgi:hypothetical protein
MESTLLGEEVKEEIERACTLPCPRPARSQSFTPPPIQSRAVWGEYTATRLSTARTIILSFAGP